MGIVATTVENAFDTAQSYAANATSQANTFINDLKTTIFTPPTVSVTWTSLAAPTLPDLPNEPSLPTISFNEPGGKPGTLTLTDPTVEFDTFTDAPPTVVFPDAPVIASITIPDVPDIGTVTVPTAPTLGTVTPPTLLSLSSVTFGGVDLHEDWLTDLQNIPDLVLVEPTPYSYTPGPEYSSALLTALQAKLAERLQGGTGLSPAVEQAIWDRARARETKTALANEQEIMRASEQLGFQLPTGALAAQLREAQQNYYDKLSELSRDVAIKQADLEQENLKATITQGIELESKLVDYSYQIERLTFEAAKQYADNAVQLHNAAIEKYKALLAGYETYSRNYKTLIDAELAKVEAYRAQLTAEQTKAQINSVLVEQYKAQIDAGMSQVKIYEAQVGAAQTLIQLEQAKINAAGEQIRGYVAKVNAETARVEAYKAQVQAEATKLEGYKVKVDTFKSKIEAQATQLQAQMAQRTQEVQAYAAQWDGWKAAVQAEAIRMDALGRQSNAKLDGYRAATAAAQAQAEMTTKVWEGNIKQYEAGLQVTLQTAKINNDAVIMTNNARLDAAKVGASTFAQLAASAYGMAHASASLSGSNNWAVQQDFKGQIPTGTTPVFDP